MEFDESGVQILDQLWHISGTEILSHWILTDEWMQIILTLTNNSFRGRWCELWKDFFGTFSSQMERQSRNTNLSPNLLRLECIQVSNKQ